MASEHLSVYSMIVPLSEESDGEMLLSNGVYGAYDIITADEWKLIKSENTEELPGETRQRLKRRGHLVCEDEKAEAESAALLSRCYFLLPYRTLMDIVIMPTYNCNFRCDYCYERKRLEKGGEWLGHTMKKEVIDAVWEQIDEYIRQNRVIRHIFLYGGEPLLASNRPQVEEIVNGCKKRGIEMVCVTNGYDLDKYIDLIKEVKFDFIQVTVDGPKQVHDKRRILAGGQGSYDRIMKNVELALKAGIRIHLRTNINRSNLESSMELVNEYKERGFLDYPNFYWYFKATIGCFEDDPANAITDLEMFETMINSGMDRTEAMQHCMVYSQVLNRVGRALERESYPLLRPAACGAESDMLVVDPDGLLYTCWDVVSMEEYAVGFTDIEAKRFRFDFSYPKWRNRTADKITDCEKCPVMFVCGGGCAIEADHEYGSINRGFCGSFKEAFKEAASYMCEKNYQKNGNRELSGSWYDLISGISESDRKLLFETMSQKESQDILKKYMKGFGRIF